MTEQEKYRLSVYTTEETLRERGNSVVEVVRSSLDGDLYIKKTYPMDKREVFEVLSKIKNRHIPQIQGVFFGQDTIVIEQYIPGKILGQLLEEKYQFSKKEVCQLFFGLLDAIDTIHKNNLIHRDIKPENIIITPEGEAVLIDYNIARIYTDGHSADTELLGTVGYAAPEQFGFAQSDCRTDIYALGMTMKQVVTKHNAPKYLRKAIQRCAEFDPARRYESVGQLRTRLGKKKNAGKLLLAAAACAAAALLAFGVGRTMGPKYDPVLYDPEEGWLITINDIEHVGGLRIEQEGTYQTKIDLGTGGKKTLVAVERVGDVCRLIVDGKELLTFTGDDSLSTADYPECRIYAELMFYDLDADGILEIIPVIAHARYVKLENGLGWILRNYTLAWCVYFDGQAFCKAQGNMIAEYESLKINDTAPTCIWGDFLCGYMLIDGKLEQVY